MAVNWETRIRVLIAWAVALILGSAAISFFWGVLIPKSADEIGFENENPTYLFGCYEYNGSRIVLKRNSADFDGEEISIEYGLRKGIREVIYTEIYPWFIESDSSFMFRDDRFDLVDLIRDDDGVWTIQIWKSDYLFSKDPADLSAVYFKKTPCDRSR